MSMNGPISQTQTTSAGDGAGPTLLTLDLSYAFANPLHAAVSSTFFGQVSKLMVEAFEKRCLADHVLIGNGSGLITKVTQRYSEKH